MIRRVPDVVRPFTLLGQNGSMMLIVLMLLALMSIIGIASTNTTITENFIVRNSAIRNQNLYLADAAAMEVVQRVLDAGLENDPNVMGIDEILPTMPAHATWVNDRTTWGYANWYNRDFVGPLLNAANSVAPESILNGDIGLIRHRGDWDGVDPDTCPIRYALVGWSLPEAGAGGGGNQNLAAGQPILRTADVLTEYLSERSGVIRLTVGVQREFKN